MSDNIDHEFGLGHALEHDFGKGKVNLTAGFYEPTGSNWCEILKIILALVSKMITIIEFPEEFRLDFEKLILLDLL